MVIIPVGIVSDDTSMHTKDIIDIDQQILEKDVDSRTEIVELNIILDDKPVSIKFTPKHFLALQTVFRILLDEEKKSSQ